MYKDSQTNRIADPEEQNIKGNPPKNIYSLAF